MFDSVSPWKVQSLKSKRNWGRVKFWPDMIFVKNFYPTGIFGATFLRKNAHVGIRFHASNAMWTGTLTLALGELLSSLRCFLKFYTADKNFTQSRQISTLVLAADKEREAVQLKFLQCRPATKLFTDHWDLRRRTTFAFWLEKLTIPIKLCSCLSSR